MEKPEECSVTIVVQHLSNDQPLHNETRNSHIHNLQEVVTTVVTNCVENSCTQQWGSDLPFLGESRLCRPAGWLAVLFITMVHVETNPGPTTTHKQVWVCNICHKQIHGRKQISIRCNRIEHCMHVRVSAKHNIQIPGPAIYTKNPDSQLTPT